ncbi:hypothetical protein AKJ53_00135 [candidate division MSBL1 archaeon SCGC-AAA382F02]|uniref:Shikimate kinase n=1 Tax=candidate division MSBL1 archaeon SCGC-AAA382F02 TaxID=1698282 RepID=A0A133VJ89_9EURY|nr:hypothetical protein AKJ53_00135 [candidate division MSBL1 archaeon SCGC-AAA382F02]
MKGTASAAGSATIVNAISTGKGAAFAIDLRVQAEVELEEEMSGVTGKVENASEDPLLIETCVRKVLEFYGVVEDYGAKVKTTSDLPTAVGLSSSSAAANATIIATSAALGEEIQSEKAINLGIEAAFDAGVTVTGAYDDASASFYGGAVVTDNEERVLLEKFPMDSDLAVLVFLPQDKSYTSDVDIKRTKLISKLVESAHDEALSGNLYGAQTLNGLLYSSVLGYSSLPALRAIEAGALSAGLSGTGSAIVAISEEENIENIEERWKDEASEIIVTRPSEEGGRIENE